MKPKTDLDAKGNSEEYLKKVGEVIQKFLERGDVKGLCKFLFQADIYPSQESVIREIAIKMTKRLAVCAYTRYGKTFSVGHALALRIILSGKKKLRIAVIAPSDSQAKEIMNEFKKAVMNCPLLKIMMDQSGETILSQVTDMRITFQNGTKVIERYTAGSSAGGAKSEMGTGAGSGLMSKGADIIVRDEDCQIPKEIYQNYIARMAEHEDAQEIALSNPWHKHNQFFNHWESGDYKTIQISYKTGIEEGRHSKEYFDGKRKDLTEIQWTVLYESVFPDQIESGLIAYSVIKAAQKRELKTGIEPVRIAGFDVAGSGKDRAVLFILDYYDGDYAGREIHSRAYSPDAMELVGWAMSKITKDITVCVDAVGMGWGAAARMRERGYDVIDVKVGESPSREKNKFMNKKAQLYWKLKELFEEGRIYLKGCENARLVKELTGMRYEFTSNEKIKIIDPESGSPDYADSMMLALAHDSGITVASIGGKE